MCRMTPLRGKWPHGRPGLRVIDGQRKTDSRKGRGLWSPWVSLASFAVHFLLRLVLDSWLNAASDWKVSVAIIILALPILFAVFAVYRSILPKLHH